MAFNLPADKSENEYTSLVKHFCSLLYFIINNLLNIEFGVF